MSGTFTEIDYLKDKAKFKEEVFGYVHKKATDTQLGIANLDLTFIKRTENIPKIEQNLINMEKNIDNLTKAINDLPEKLKDTFVIKDDFNIIKAEANTNSAIIKWVIWVVTTVFIAWIIYLSFTK